MSDQDVTAMAQRLIETLAYVDDDVWQEGTYWYAKAHSDTVKLATAYRVTIETAAGVVAALSPRLPWERNIEYAWRMFGTGHAPVLGSNRAKAQRIINGEHPADVLSGPKVRAFYACLLSPCGEHVCVDRHAIDAALGIRGDDKSRKIIARAGVYDAIALAYRVAAAYFGISPAQCQAIVWVAWRNEYARKVA